MPVGWRRGEGTVVGVVEVAATIPDCRSILCEGRVWRVEETGDVVVGCCAPPK